MDCYEILYGQHVVRTEIFNLELGRKDTTLTETIVSFIIILIREKFKTDFYEIAYHQYHADHFIDPIFYTGAG